MAWMLWNIAVAIFCFRQSWNTEFDLQVMNTSFERNSIRPGDPDYEYDKQVDFDCGEKVEAGWDSQEEDFWSWTTNQLVC